MVTAFGPASPMMRRQVKSLLSPNPLRTSTKAPRKSNRVKFPNDHRQRWIRNAHYRRPEHTGRCSYTQLAQTTLLTTKTVAHEKQFKESRTDRNTHATVKRVPNGEPCTWFSRDGVRNGDCPQEKIIPRVMFTGHRTRQGVGKFQTFIDPIIEIVRTMSVADCMLAITKPILNNCKSNTVGEYSYFRRRERNDPFVLNEFYRVNKSKHTSCLEIFPIRIEKNPKEPLKPWKPKEIRIRYSMTGLINLN